MYAGDDRMSVHDQFGLVMRQLAVTKLEHTELTLKTVRILLSSTFQPAITSLSFLACQNRDIALRPSCLKTWFRISATVLQSIA